MNIGFLYTNYEYPPTSGSGVHGYQLVKNLSNLGHKFYCYYYGGMNPLIKQYRGRDIIKFLKIIDILYIRTDIRYRNELFTLLKIARFFRIPLIWEINAPPQERLLEGNLNYPSKYLQYRRYYLSKMVDAGICVSKPVMLYAEKELCIKKNYFIPNGSDPMNFSPKKKIVNFYNKSFNVLWAGATRFSWHGLDIIVDVARELERNYPDIGFVIIGDKRFLPDNLPLNVYCPGEIPYTEMPSYIASADIGIVVYKDAQNIPGGLYFSPIKLFDYLASGLTVIAHNLEQITEIVKDGSNGILCDGTKIDIVRKIIDIYNNRDLQNILSTNARKTIEGFYNWERVAKQTEQIMKELLGGR